MVAIHQPNFFPWLGFFDKLRRSDVFIMMDTAQIPKSGASYTNKVDIATRNGRFPISLNIKRIHNVVIPIMHVEILADVKRKKIAKTIEHSYKTAPYFHSEFPFIKDLIMNNETNLCDYNINAIMRAAERICINNGKIIKSSDLGFIMTKGNLSQLIVNMVKSVGGTIFLSGPRSAWHMDKSVFDAAGVQIHFTEYSCPCYRQVGSSMFVPGLSFIDAALNIGFSGVQKLLV